MVQEKVGTVVVPESVWGQHCRYTLRFDIEHVNRRLFKRGWSWDAISIMQSEGA